MSSSKTLPKIWANICPYCSKQFADFKNGYLSHLNNDHGWNIRETTLFFDSYKAFELWKTHEEIAKMSQFRFAHHYNEKNCLIRRYECIRSGLICSKREPKNSNKNLRSTRLMNATCAARMVVHSYLDGRIEVKYVSEHVGHDNDIRHLRVNSVERNFIRRQLLAGKSCLSVLQNCRNSSEFPRLTLVSSQFIRKILKDLKMEQIAMNKRHQDGVKLRLNVELFEITDDCYRFRLHEEDQVNNKPRSLLGYKQQPNNTNLNCEVVLNRKRMHNHQCKEDCLHRVKCQHCANLCYHSVQCTCDEYRVEQKICVHIHFAIWQQLFSQQNGDHTYGIASNYKAFFFVENSDDNSKSQTAVNSEDDLSDSDCDSTDSSNTSDSSITSSSAISELSGVFPTTRTKTAVISEKSDEVKTKSKFLQKYGDLLEKITRLYDSDKNGTVKRKLSIQEKIDDSMCHLSRLLMVAPPPPPSQTVSDSKKNSPVTKQTKKKSPTINQKTIPVNKYNKTRKLKC